MNAILNEIILRVEKEFGVEEDQPRYSECGESCLYLEVPGLLKDDIMNKTLIGHSESVSGSSSSLKR